MTEKKGVRLGEVLADVPAGSFNPAAHRASLPLFWQALYQVAFDTHRNQIIDH